MMRVFVLLILPLHSLTANTLLFLQIRLQLPTPTPAKKAQLKFFV